jgi:electron transport complex protein RnfC
MAFTFPGGVHPNPMKDMTEKVAVRPAPVPERLFIPMAQHIGAPAKPLLKKGI